MNTSLLIYGTIERKPNMDMIWDQDVRVTLAAIIGREKEDETDEQVAKNIQLAIRYANKLGEARAVLERKPPVSSYRPRAR